MKTTDSMVSTPSTRRDFLKQSGAAVTGLALAGALPAVHAAEDHTIKVALIGCGGRGTGAAANALRTQGPTKLWAMADVFEPQIENSHRELSGPLAKQLEVPPERRFVGMDAYKKAMDTLKAGDVVLLTTPPAFRPMHFEYAVQKGLHVFMEKSFAVDAPGIRRLLKTGEAAAAKNLKVATGLMSRHHKPLEEAMAKIHEGAIGDLVTLWAYRMHGPVGIKPRQPGMSELAYQLSNYCSFTWLNGSFILDWLIHNIDVCCWAKQGWPVSVQGSGGRQVRQDADQLFDHYQAEYTFADGSRMMAQGRHLTNTWSFFGNVFQGTKGLAVLGEGQPKPRLFKGWKQSSENLLWQYKGGDFDHYQHEHDLFFDAIRNNKPCHEVERSAKSCFTAIMGRMACESGELITWDEALASNLELAPGLDAMTLDSPPPASARPDAQGKYPVAMPGQTKVL